MNSIVRLMVRRVLRKCLAVSPDWVKRGVERVPFSRYHTFLGRVLAGREQISWRSVTLEVNPGEIEGYFLFFFGVSRACADAEINQVIDLCGNEGALFFDVGANVGVMSLAVAAACPKVEVVAFEPDSGAAARFRRNLVLNPNLAQRITLVDRAITDFDGEVLFFPSRDPGSSELGSILKGKDVDQAVPRSTPCTRLDSFCAQAQRNPDIIKIDVEGAELQVLQGMTGLSWPRGILVEVHGLFYPDTVASVYERIYQLLVKTGYQLFELEDSTTRPCRQPEDWPLRLHILACRST